jgi:hypothetical protein
MSTTPSEIWNNILKDNVGKDDPLWNEYLDKSGAFDVRMVDEWNKIVDVLLVYVGYFKSLLSSRVLIIELIIGCVFISVLTSFIIPTSTQFKLGLWADALHGSTRLTL